jgi:predicted enzyme involved in methoxymalonyl-ACP biosynthesis
MSCRVIGRTVERTMLADFAQRARDGGCSELRGTYVPSAKNGVVRELYRTLGFEAAGSEAAGGTTTWRRPIDDEVCTGSPFIALDPRSMS